MAAAGIAARGDRRSWAPLHSAVEEQQWIDAGIAGGVAEPRLALASYPDPAVIYGRRGGEEPARLARAREEGLVVIRRRTGGGAVLAGPWLIGFHALLPAAHPVAKMGVVASMVWLGKVACTALLLSRVASRVADAADMAGCRARAADAGVDWACYGGLSHGELLDAEGHKLLGLSQGRGRWGVLLSGGLLVGESPWESLEYVYANRRPARSRLRELASRGLAAVAPGVSVSDVCARLASCLDLALAAEFGGGNALPAAGGANHGGTIELAPAVAFDARGGALTSIRH